jgi:hypothetical protein
LNKDRAIPKRASGKTYLEKLDMGKRAILVHFMGKLARCLFQHTQDGVQDNLGRMVCGGGRPMHPRWPDAKGADGRGV